MSQMVKNLPAMWETQFRSLGREDPMEKGMATRSRILAWRIPWTEEPGGLPSTGLQKVGHDLATSLTRCTCMLLNQVQPRLTDFQWTHKCMSEPS